MRIIRRLGKDPLEFLVKNIIPNNLFVSIGYFHDSALGYGPKTRKKVTKDNDATLTGYINGEELINSPRFKKHLQAFVDSDKYKQVLTGERNSAPMDIPGDVHIIKISRTVIRWMQNKRFLSQYGKWAREEQDIRARHGFGKSPDEYSDTDWHHKVDYRGIDIEPGKIDIEGKHRQRFNKSVGQSGLFTADDEPNRYAIRQFTDLSLAERPEWYFIDEDGEAERLNNNLLRFLNTAYSQHKVKEAIQEISEDEKAFLDDIQKLQDKSKSECLYYLENVLYITGTSLTPEGDKEPFTWVNTDMIYKKYPWLDRKFLNSIIERYIEFSAADIEKLTESFIANFDNSISLLEAVDQGIRLALDDFNNYEEEQPLTKTEIVNSSNVLELRAEKIYYGLDRGIIPNINDLQLIERLYRIHNIEKYIIKNKNQLQNIINVYVNAKCNEINLNWVSVENLTDFVRLFQKMQNVTVDCSEWDTSRVKKFNYVFAFSQKTSTIKANNWTFDSAEELNGMFYACKANVEIDDEQWNTNNVETMGRMFLGCDSKLLEYANRLDISNCIDFNSMFKNTKYIISNETQFPIIDLSEWHISTQCDIDDMFENSNIPKNLQPKIVNGSSYSFTPQSGKIDRRKATQDFKAAINTFIDQTKCKKLNGEVSIYSDPIYSGRIIFPDDSLGDFQFNIKNGKCDVIYKQRGLSIDSGFDLDKLISIVNSMF